MDLRAKAVRSFEMGFGAVDVADEIDQMVARIADQFDPDLIVLFGSHARGQAATESDIDLLVVIPISERGSRRELATEIDRALSDRKVPLDLIVVTPQELERGKNQIGSILRPAMAEGRVVYERAA